MFLFTCSKLFGVFLFSFLPLVFDPFLDQRLFAWFALEDAETTFTLPYASFRDTARSCQIPGLPQVGGGDLQHCGGLFQAYRKFSTRKRSLSKRSTCANKR
jgi:hypothetical protein